MAYATYLSRLNHSILKVPAFILQKNQKVSPKPSKKRFTQLGAIVGLKSIADLK